MSSRRIVERNELANWKLYTRACSMKAVQDFAAKSSELKGKS
jgi:hypothetical protein